MAFWRNHSPSRLSTRDRGAKAVNRRGDDGKYRRNLAIEPCEERQLLSINNLELISVIPNQGGSIIAANETLNVAPTQITLNFTNGLTIDPSTLGAITITRAGGDGILGNSNDVVVTTAGDATTPITTDSTGYIGVVASSPNQVVIRFDKPLPSDLYQINIASTLSDTGGDTFAAESLKFTLDLGAQVASVVPQPVTRNANGTLSQNLNEIDVYFNTSTLQTASATNTANYELINTQGTATNADDTIVHPTGVTYDPVNNVAKLTFSATALATAGSYRLRIGNSDPIPLTPTVIDLTTSTAQPGSTIDTALNLGSFGGSNQVQSTIVTNGYIGNTMGLNITYPGSVDDPSHRNIPVGGGIENEVGGSGGATVVTFNFPTIYGQDPISGDPLYNQITAQQEQDAVDILALYANYLGVQFEEVSNSGGAGIGIVTGDPRAVDPTLSPSAVGGIEGGGLALVNGSIDWSGAASQYGGGWMTVAMHEIGHALGYLHADDAPPLTIMNGGAEATSSTSTSIPGLPGPEPVFPGDVDIVNGQYLIAPDANDINMYQFTVTQSGTVNLQTVAERLGTPSLLNSVLTVFNSSGNELAQNDDYYGTDSALSLDLPAGTYYAGVTSTGNTTYNPNVPFSGSGGTSMGAYNLNIAFTPDNVAGLVDQAGTEFDGTGDGQPGGTFNFWFNAAPTLSAANVTTAHTIYVDKAAPANQSGLLGSLSNPYTNIATALAATSAGDVLRILGNSQALTNDADAYNIGYNLLNQSLSDGTTLAVPHDVTVEVDGAGGYVVFKMDQANVTVGSVSQGIDLSGGSLQVLGTPVPAAASTATTYPNSVIFTSYNDQTIAPVANPLNSTPTPGDWGGIVFNQDSDVLQPSAGSVTSTGVAGYADTGIFVNTVEHATIEYGGGQVLVNSTSQVFDPIHIVSTRPNILNNTILNSADAAMSANPNSFADSEFETLDPATLAAGQTPYVADYGRTGPNIHGNVLQGNSINGMFVRINTSAGASLDQLTVPATFANTDIAYVLTENLIIAGTPTRIVDGVGQMNGRLTIDPGVVVKLQGARIETTTGSAQLIAEGTASNPVIMTSLLDDQYGAGGTFATTNNAGQEPAPGDWGGLYFGPVTSGSLDFVILQYAGGTTSIEGGSATFNAIEVYQAKVRVADSVLQYNAAGGDGTTRDGRQAAGAATIYVIGAQPSIVNNVIQNNAGPVISINVNALNNLNVPDWGRSTGLANAYTQFSNNDGPLVRLNQLANNGINGMLVRGGQMTTQGVWDDTDITYVLESAIVIGGSATSDLPGNQQTYNGLTIESSSTQSLVVKLLGQYAGFNVGGYPLDISDRIGGTLQILGQPGHPVIMTSLNDNSVGAGTMPGGQPDLDTGNNSAATPAAGDWDSVTIGEFSNDTNLLETNEYNLGSNANTTPQTAQYLGALAPNQLSGNDTQRLGFQVNGALLKTSDVNVYSFTAQAGTETYFQLDRTALGLDSVIELVDAHGAVVASEYTDAAGQPIYTGLAEVPGASSVAATYSLAANGPANGTNPLSLGQVGPAVTDPYSQNPHDAAMVVVLPGATGSTNTYYVRVRSYSPDTLTVGGAAGSMGTSLDGQTLSLTSTAAPVANSGLATNVQFQFVAPGGTAGAGYTGITVSNATDTPLSVANAIAAAINAAGLGVNAVVSNVAAASPQILLYGSPKVVTTAPASLLSDTSGLTSLTGGQSDGIYTLQIRLQQQVQFPGTLVQYANLDYSTNGVQVQGQPNLSPLLGESESNTANNSFATAENLGNLLNSNQATVAVGGNLQSSTQVDWYKLQVNYDLIQKISGLSTADNTIAAMFDVDYAGGLTRADTTLGVYNSAGELLFIGRDSDVPDDQLAPGQNGTVQSTSAGSISSLDPFIGSQQLPAGPTDTYYIAVTSAAQLPQDLNQTYVSAATDTLARLQPIDSITRPVEDHFTVNPTKPPATTSADTSGTAGPATTIFGNSAANIDSHDIAYNLGNVVLYVTGQNGGNTNLYTVNPQTGGTENNLGGMSGNFQDITMRNDGELYGIPQGGNPTTDANSDNFVQVSGANGSALSTTSDGIVTYEENPAMPLTAAGAPNYINIPAGQAGVQIRAIAYQQTTGSSANREVIGIGGISSVFGDNQPTNNLIYEFDPNTGQVQNIAATLPQLDSNANFGRLNIGSGILTVNSSGVPLNGGTINVGNTLTTFTVTGANGTTVTYEFLTGPAATLPATGGAAVSDGQTIVIGGRTFEFTEGKVMTIGGTAGTLATQYDDQTLSVSNNASPAVTANFQFVIPGETASPGYTPIILSSNALTTAATIATSVTAAINNAGLGVTATSFVDGSGNQKISVVNASNIVTGAPITLSGTYGVNAGNIPISFSETETQAQLGAAIASAVNAADVTGMTPAGIVKASVNAAGTGISFLSANPANTSFTNSALTPVNNVTTATGGDIPVYFNYGDTAQQLASEMASAVNTYTSNNAGYGVTATGEGDEVTLLHEANFTVTSPLTQNLQSGGGNITGIAFLNGNQNVLYAVTDNGDLFSINIGAAGSNGYLNPQLTYITDIGNKHINFTGLTGGPPDVSNGAYANDLFATDAAGNLYAFNTSGTLQKVFTSAANVPNSLSEVSTGVAGATGLAFSTLDYNLWHVTSNQAGVVGHGINAAPDNSQPAVDGGTSLYFGLDTPDPSSTNLVNVSNQPGNPNGANSAYSTNSSLYGTYALPGGATGMTESSAFSLAGYSAQDKPTLYFTYQLSTRVADSLSNVDDTFRVYVVSTDPTTGNPVYTEVATNNQVLSNPGKTNAELPAYLSSDGGGENGSYRPNDLSNQNVQELFDNTGWRQARVDLGNFAGDSNLKLLFSFSTYGTSGANANGVALALPGDQFGGIDGNAGGAGATTADQGVWVDDIIVGFAGRGETVTYPAGDANEDNTNFYQVPVNNAPGAAMQSLTGPYELEVRRGTEYGATKSPNLTGAIKLYQAFDINDRLDQSIDLVAPSGSQLSSGEEFSVSDGVNAISLEFITAAQSPSAGATAVVYSANMSASAVANAIVTAINSQTPAKITAQNADPSNLTSDRVELFGAQSAGGVGQNLTGQMTESYDSIYNAISSGLSSTNPGTFTAGGTIGDNSDLATTPGLDVDYASFELSAGDTATITVTAPVGGNGANTLITLFDQSGNPIATSTNGAGLTRTLTFTAPAGSGVNTTYYIGISGYLNTSSYDPATGLYTGYNPFIQGSGVDGGSEGLYTLNVAVGATAAPISEIVFDNQGDENTPRLQGYTIIADNTISHALDSGIAVTAGATYNNSPVPGSPRVLPVLNAQSLVPGVTLENNIIDGSGQFGIDLVGGISAAAGAPQAPVLFSHIVNNTIYGNGKGVGINVSNGSGPTIMNNIIANTGTAIAVDASSQLGSLTILEANLYQDNTSLGAGGSEQYAIQLKPTDPLFVDAANGNFYPAAKSQAIDSSLNSLQDRPNMVQVDATLGIPASPIIAPAYDELGQLRVDDASVASPPGLGQNVYIDRGALDRADFTDPTSVLVVPTPNAAAPTTAAASNQPTQFSIQFNDGTGTGVDPATVTASQFTLTGPDPNNPSNIITLSSPSSYLFSYNATNHIATFTAAAGVWIPGTYTITVNNAASTAASPGIADLAGNPLAPNNSSGTVLYTITVTSPGSTLPAWQNPQNHLDVSGDGNVSAIDALIDINALNDGLGGVLPATPPGGEPPPYYDVNGDGALTPADVIIIINYLNAQALAGAADVAAAVPAAVTPTVSVASVGVTTAVASPAAVSLAAVSLAAAVNAGNLQPVAVAVATPAVQTNSSSPSTTTYSSAEYRAAAAQPAAISWAAKSAASDSVLASNSWQDYLEVETALADLAAEGSTGTASSKGDFDFLF